ncbi:membrane protein, RfbX family [Clostridium pasteurianum DSM 525 = ATCC 6013]|uniref:Membrane protein, RfbX family n=1 Tax=Clostridium pasteurianum DSM 525 = ATCC 6013 TaxID=1262449 RepID=A0A0H3J1L5_CLOPA|nr:flippase [Clostridium pasteurianum]AJA47786.1 membrane protein, RfbX family [Clostridium pasteurianum DSM 525 = ATCC 6013]AJA51774.1 membrane protein, RfbX family [Clostridium pasteurianum DSM 525 = ATCC 6013]AOZ75083.1 teichoic acid transporter [Clostridium pasteurianum DSM 525 = ATCC 6013]AOZ78878.1 teichoic acid transporter [Clostridium pasteurianum]ELP59687.1 Membrane protein, RfbX family [Clostridium pasteurianum DSM 525 = ATCC 6013]
MNRVAKNFLLTISSSLISQVIVFFTGTYYATKIGASYFGTVNTVQAMILYFTMVVLFGLQTYGTREIAKDRENIKQVVGDILIFRFILFILSFAVIVIISSAFENNINSIKTLFILYGLTLLPTAMNIDWVFNGIQEMKYNAVYNIIKNIIPFILIYIFLREKSQVYYIPLFTFIALFIGTIYQGYIYFFKKRFTLSINLNKKKFISYVNFGLPFLISGILAMINTNVDRIIIMFTRGSEEAGIYGSAYYIILFLINIETMIFTPIFPLIINYFNNNDRENLKKLMNNTSKIITAFIMPVVIGGILLSKDIIVLLFDKSFIGAYSPFIILLLYALILFFREIYGWGLNACGMEKKYLKTVTISALVNLILNLIFTPRYGMNMAAAITVLSEIINIVMMRYYAKRIIIVSNYINIIKSLFPCFIMAIVIIILKYFNINVVFTIILSAIFYSIFIIITKYITLQEVRSILIGKNGGV